MRIGGGDVIKDKWANWTDEELIEYEQELYDQEVGGDDTWALRDDVLWEINWRSITPSAGH